MFVQLQKSTMVYQRKNLGVAAWGLAKMIYVASDSMRAVVWYLKSLVRQDPALRRKSAAAVAALRYHVLGVEPT
jgi:hypothetical protein